MCWLGLSTYLWPTSRVGVTLKNGTKYKMRTERRVKTTQPLESNANSRPLTSCQWNCIQISCRLVPPVKFSALYASLQRLDATVMRCVMKDARRLQHEFYFGRCAVWILYHLKVSVLLAHMLLAVVENLNLNQQQWKAKRCN